MNINQNFSELIDNQISNVSINKRLLLKDIKRLCRHIDTSIFNKDICSIWKGYISKDIYINFFFRNKKVALHRLLYSNYVSELNDNEYLKYSCNNKRKCCNIYHMYKNEYMNRNINSNIIYKYDTKINDDCILIFE